MAIFYHVSTNLKHKGYFEPRIPDNRHQQSEDDTIARVCVCPSIEDCFTAIPNGGGELAEFNNDCRGYYKIIRIDTDKLGINPENIISYETLFQKDLVRDAEMTNEHWITTSFNIPDEDMFLIRLTDWDEEPYDVIPHAIYEIADKDYEGDYIRAYEDIEDDFVPCSVVIKNIEFITENPERGTSLRLFFNSEEENIELKKFLQSEYQINDFGYESMDELVIDLNDNYNLKSLFLFHTQILEDIYH